jgi:hypothetical protein
MNSAWWYTGHKQPIRVNHPGAEGGFIKMRPWNHGRDLPPLEPDHLQYSRGKYSRDWLYDYKDRRRIAEPHAGGGPGNVFAGWGPYYPYGPYQGPR